MNGLNEAPTWGGVAPLLLWIKILEVLVVVLLAVALFTGVVGWVRRLSWWIRLSALVPLAAGVGAAISVHRLHDTYVFWANVCNWCCGHGCAPGSAPIAEQVAGNAAHTAAELGWIGMGVAGLWLFLGLLGLSRQMPPRRRQQPPSLAVRP